MDENAINSARGSNESDAAGQRRSRRDRQTPRGFADVAKLFEALPPHAIEAEMSLLGSMLWDSKIVGDVVAIVRSGGDFYRPAHTAIYDAMVELYDKSGGLDLITLNQALIDKGLLDAVGGLNYLVSLAEGVPGASAATHYARLVREKATVRDLIGAAGEILHDAHTSRDLSYRAAA